MMKRAFVVIMASFLLLAMGCGTTEPTVSPETFTVVDRQTGVIYYPDLEPAPEIVGSTVTFTQGGKAYILSGNWLIVGDLRD